MISNMIVLSGLLQKTPGFRIRQGTAEAFSISHESKTFGALQTDNYR
jgi:hypothetical protein